MWVSKLEEKWNEKKKERELKAQLVMHVRERFIDERHQLDNGKYHQRHLKEEGRSQQ